LVFMTLSLRNPPSGARIVPVSGAVA